MSDAIAIIIAMMISIFFSLAGLGLGIMIEHIVEDELDE